MKLSLWISELFIWMLFHNWVHIELKLCQLWRTTNLKLWSKFSFGFWLRIRSLTLFLEKHYLCNFWMYKTICFSHKGRISRLYLTHFILFEGKETLNNIVSNISFKKKREEIYYRRMLWFTLNMISAWKLSFMSLQ